MEPIVLSDDSSDDEVIVTSVRKRGSSRTNVVSVDDDDEDIVFVASSKAKLNRQGNATVVLSVPPKVEVANEESSTLSRPSTSTAELLNLPEDILDPGSPCHGANVDDNGNLGDDAGNKGTTCLENLDVNIDIYTSSSDMSEDPGNVDTDVYSSYNTSMSPLSNSPHDADGGGNSTNTTDQHSSKISPIFMVNQQDYPDNTRKDVCPAGHGPSLIPSTGSYIHGANTHVIVPTHGAVTNQEGNTNSSDEDSRQSQLSSNNTYGLIGSPVSRVYHSSISQPLNTRLNQTSNADQGSNLKLRIKRCYSVEQQKGDSGDTSGKTSTFTSALDFDATVPVLGNNDIQRNHNSASTSTTLGQTAGTIPRRRNSLKLSIANTFSTTIPSSSNRNGSNEPALDLSIQLTSSLDTSNNIDSLPPQPPPQDGFGNFVHADNDNNGLVTPFSPLSMPDIHIVNNNKKDQDNFSSGCSLGSISNTDDSDSDSDLSFPNLSFGSTNTLASNHDGKTYGDSQNKPASSPQSTYSGSTNKPLSISGTTSSGEQVLHSSISNVFKKDLNLNDSLSYGHSTKDNNATKSSGSLLGIETYDKLNEGCEKIKQYNFEGMKQQYNRKKQRKSSNPKRDHMSTNLSDYHKHKQQLLRKLELIGKCKKQKSTFNKDHCDIDSIFNDDFTVSAAQGNNNNQGHSSSGSNKGKSKNKGKGKNSTMSKQTHKTDEVNSNSDDSEETSKDDGENEESDIIVVKAFSGRHGKEYRVVKKEKSDAGVSSKDESTDNKKSSQLDPYKVKSFDDVMSLGSQVPFRVPVIPLNLSQRSYASPTQLNPPQSNVSGMLLKPAHNSYRSILPNLISHITKSNQRSSFVCNPPKCKLPKTRQNVPGIDLITLLPCNDGASTSATTKNTNGLLPSKVNNQSNDSGKSQNSSNVDIQNITNTGSSSSSVMDIQRTDNPDSSNISRATAGGSSNSSSSNNSGSNFYSSTAISSSYIPSTSSAKTDSNIPYKKRKLALMNNTINNELVGLSQTSASNLTSKYDTVVPASSAPDSSVGSSSNSSSFTASGLHFEEKTCYYCAMQKPKSSLSSCTKAHYCCGSCLQDHAKDVLLGKKINPPSGSTAVLTNDESVDRCAKFLSTLHRLSLNGEYDSKLRVPNAIQNLIDGVLDPMQFMFTVQGILKGKNHPVLVAFLKKSLPMLQCKLFLNTLTLDGYRPPPMKAIDMGVMTQISAVTSEPKSMASWSLQCRYPMCNSYFPMSELRKTLPSMVVDMLEEKLDQSFMNFMDDELMKTIDQSTAGTSSSSSSSSTSQPGTDVCPLDISPVDKASKVDSNKSSDLPEHWAPMDEDIDYVLIDLDPQSEEYVVLAALFHNTMYFPKADIVRIRRVQNHNLWRAYQLKKKKICKENPDIEIEKQLFHGTRKDTIESICRDNFDWRLCGHNGTAFGQGSYFARDASYSHRYSLDNSNSHPSATTRAALIMARQQRRHTLYQHIKQTMGSSVPPQGPQAHPYHLNSIWNPLIGINSLSNPASLAALMANPASNPTVSSSSSSSNVPSFGLPTPNHETDGSTSHTMFVARVLTGVYTVGHSLLKRPPPLNIKEKFGKMYDSCVDRTNDPQVFVVFEHQQCYPEYILDYKNQPGAVW